MSSPTKYFASRDEQDRFVEQVFGRGKAPTNDFHSMLEANSRASVRGEVLPFSKADLWGDQ
jgi:hypothetical protein